MLRVRPWSLRGVVVHPWMLAPADAALDAAGKLAVHRERLQEALALVAESSVEGSAEDFPGPGRPAPPAAVHCRDALLAAVDLAHQAFSTLAAGLAEHGPPLRRLLDGSSGTDRLRRVQVRAHTDALSDVDAACRRLLEQAIRTLPEPAEVTRAGGWVRAVLPAASALERIGALAPVAQLRAYQELAEQATPIQIRDRLRRDHPTAAGVRRALACCPDLAVRLAEARDQPAEGRLPPGSEPLWPALVGPQEGADPARRVAGNRHLVRAALVAARRDDSAVEALAEAYRKAESRDLLTRARGRLTAAWLDRGRLGSLLALESDQPGRRRGDLRVRIRLYQALLYDQVPADATGALPPQPRQVLLFDPSGPGRLAELWGPVPQRAARVVVFVPGTGTAIAGFHEPSRVARDLAEAGIDGGTAAIAWMGADFPLGIGNQALLSRFAREAAAPLCAHLDGLGVPTGVPITLIGHSYGGVMVGAAERNGIRADRVVHLASPGAGPAVRSVTDYADRDSRGRPRSVRRYVLTAPGDPVRWARRRARGRAGGRVRRRSPVPAAAAMSRLAAAVDLGVDPTRLAGVVVLPAGEWEVDAPGRRRGQRLFGPSGHADVTRPGTTAFRRLTEVVNAPL